MFVELVFFSWQVVPHSWNNCLQCVGMLVCTASAQLSWRYVKTPLQYWSIVMLFENLAVCHILIYIVNFQMFPVIRGACSVNGKNTISFLCFNKTNPPSLATSTDFLIYSPFCFFSLKFLSFWQPLGYLGGGGCCSTWHPLGILWLYGNSLTLTTTATTATCQWV